MARFAQRPLPAEDLLVLKMIFEKIDRKEVARIGALPLAAVDAAMERAVEKGSSLLPGPAFGGIFPSLSHLACNGGQYRTSPAFTLQWHVTQACDLHCRHLLRPGERSTLTLDEALRILDDLDGFCRRKHVKGQVSFTGGNPLLHPDFPPYTRLPQILALHWLSSAILHRGAARGVDLHSAAQFFQVSLEGFTRIQRLYRGKVILRGLWIFLICSVISMSIQW